MPATEPMRIWHLLTHTSGLTYGFHYAHPVDAMYRAAGFEWGSPPDLDLAGAVDVWASMPLLFEPGTEWNYSVSTDVLGRLVEVVSGQPLDQFLAEHVFEPLGMTDTGFSVAESEQDRLAALYGAGPERTAVPLDAWGTAILSPPTMLSGGGGLVSSAADYHRFTQMLRDRGELDGVRLLSPRTVDYMARNHLPGGADLETDRSAAVRRDHLRRRRLRPRLLGRARPGRQQGPVEPGRVRLGWRGQHRLLGRPGRGPDRAVLHPAAAVEHLSRSAPS